MKKKVYANQLAAISARHPLLIYPSVTYAQNHHYFAYNSVNHRSLHLTADIQLLQDRKSEKKIYTHLVVTFFSLQLDNSNANKKRLYAKHKECCMTDFSIGYILEIQQKLAFREIISTLTGE